MRSTLLTRNTENLLQIQFSMAQLDLERSMYHPKTTSFDCKRVTHIITNLIGDEAEEGNAKMQEPRPILIVQLGDSVSDSVRFHRLALFISSANSPTVRGMSRVGTPQR